MISGAHAILYSKKPDRDRAFLRDVLGLPWVDAGRGWLIFGLPPAEVAVHPAANASHELFLMCDDIDAFVAAMAQRRLRCTAVEDQGWGRLVRLTLPGGGTIGVYEPRHARPKAARVVAKGPVARRGAKRSVVARPKRRAAPPTKAAPTAATKAKRKGRREA